MDFEYFIYPALKELESTTDPERQRRLRALIAASIYSPELLSTEVEGLDLRQLLKEFAPKPQSGPKTSDDLIIDSFIEKFGRPGQKELDAPLLPETSPSTDYFSSVAEEGEKAEISTQPEAPEDTKISSSDSSQNLRGEEVGTEPQKEAENSTEWLQTLKNLIKNRDYAGATAFINENYLNNPEKSIYFADQIRFIKKMMLNEERKHN